jgi:hypothetical protein
LWCRCDLLEEEEEEEEDEDEEESLEAVAVAVAVAAVADESADDTEDGEVGDDGESERGDASVDEGVDGLRVVCVSVAVVGAMGYSLCVFLLLLLQSSLSALRPHSAGLHWPAEVLMAGPASGVDEQGTREVDLLVDEVCLLDLPCFSLSWNCRRRLFRGLQIFW